MPKSVLHALDSELFDLIDRLLALVVALARVAFGVLVGEDRAGRLEHRARGVVLAGDEAHRVGFAALLLVDERRDLGIDFGERRLVPIQGRFDMGPEIRPVVAVVHLKRQRRDRSAGRWLICLPRCARPAAQ